MCGDPAHPLAILAKRNKPRKTSAGLLPSPWHGHSRQRTEPDMSLLLMVACHGEVNLCGSFFFFLIPLSGGEMTGGSKKAGEGGGVLSWQASRDTDRTLGTETPH